jgi:hypothetical protein
MDNDAVVAPGPTGGAPAWARSIEAAAIAGVGFALLALVGVYMMLDLTDRVSSGADAAEWLQEGTNQTQQVVALNLISISSIAFVWFVAVIRRRIGEREDRFFGTVFIGSGIAFVAVWLAGATAMTAPAFALTYFDGASVSNDTISYAAGLGAAYLWVVLPRVGALFVVSTATIIRRTGALPAWLAVLSYVVGLGLLVVPMIARPIGFVFPAWVLLVSVTILIARHERDSG